MAYCSEHTPRRVLLKSQLSVPPPNAPPLLPCGATPLLCPLGLDGASIALYSDAEQLQHFGLPFASPPPPSVPAGCVDREVILDLRRVGVASNDDARVDSASEAVRSQAVCSLTHEEAHPHH
jgi:hypothetical protein